MCCVENGVDRITVTVTGSYALWTWFDLRVTVSVLRFAVRARRAVGFLVLCVPHQRAQRAHTITKPRADPVTQCGIIRRESRGSLCRVSVKQEKHAAKSDEFYETRCVMAQRPAGARGTGSRVSAAKTA